MTDSDPELATTVTFESWFQLAKLDKALTESGSPLEAFKQCLKQGNKILGQQFDSGIGAPVLVHARSWLIDMLLMRMWARFMGTDSGHAALVAVGGYGRNELMPGSDVDLLILLPDDENNRFDAQITELLTFLWDTGLEVGHSVRTIHDCIEQSLADVTVVTNLMEARLLAGSEDLFGRMQESTASTEIWNSRKFFEVKSAEQLNRHNKYHNSAYNLEPNIKEGPGGLRDIQMIAWVTSRHFGTASLQQLVDHGFLIHTEYETLVEGRNLLWNIRFALHMLTGRGEDRLLFDYQRTLASTFGFQDDDKRLGVEAFMKQYYRTIMELSRLNEMLLQLFHENILYPEGPGEPVVINKRFQSRGGYIEIKNARVFAHYPFALLEIFLLLEQDPKLQGVCAGTIRAIRQHCHLIDDDYRDDIRARSLFMEIFRQPQGLTHQLRRMNVYGVLAVYLPAFGNIVGLMQYDLFHIYTVDEHTLKVVRNLRRFNIHEFTAEFPLCSHVIATLPKPELLYLSGLFHDIAKGRGGDHSTLGGEIAHSFCVRHDLGKFDAELVTWLVNNHLLMSSTAQRQDISDPVVVNRFAATVGNTMYLDYLYLLTVADIRGTNPEMWNSWKDALLKQLYYNTRRALQRGLQDPLERAEHIQHIREATSRLLQGAASRASALWDSFGDEYFLRHSPEQIAHHTQLLINRPDDNNIVDIQPVTERGGTEILIFAPSGKNLFSRITAVLDQLGLNVVNAGITTTTDNHILDTFDVLGESGEAVTNDMRIEEIRTALLDEINNGGDRQPWQITRRTPRQYQHFPIKTQLEFKQDMFDHRTVMELVTADRPGLLSHIGRAFTECGVKLLNARIATLGSRVEDVYYITDKNNEPLTDTLISECLEKAIYKHLAIDNNPASGNIK